MGIVIFPVTIVSSNGHRDFIDEDGSNTIGIGKSAMVIAPGFGYCYIFRQEYDVSHRTFILLASGASIIN